MAIKKIDLTMSTIAVTTEHPPEPVSLDLRAFETVLKRPLTLGQSAAGMLISSQRDQIEVIISARKIDVRDLSGNTKFSGSQIPTVLESFIGKTGFNVNSYGVNFILAVPRTVPARWIRDNIFAPGISEKIGKKVVGGSALLNIESEHKTWSIRLDPTDTENLISVNLNASQLTTQLPSQDRLREELQEQFDELCKFLDDLGV